MAEENIITKEIGNIVKAIKLKKSKNNFRYLTIGLMVLGLLLIVQTVQLALLKSKISNGSFGAKAAEIPAAAGDLPNMSGGC